jgi:hypothetical protein
MNQSYRGKHKRYTIVPAPLDALGSACGNTNTNQSTSYSQPMLSTKTWAMHGDLLILCVVLTGILNRVAIVSQSEEAQMAQTMARRSMAGSLLKILISTGYEVLISNGRVRWSCDSLIPLRIVDATRAPTSTAPKNSVQLAIATA